MRLVLDTSVVIAALRSPSGASAELLRCIRHNRATLLLSTPLMLEYETVCGLARHRLAARNLSMADIELFLDGLASLSEVVQLHYHWRPQLRDAGDEMVLETAVNGMADALVTFNLRDFQELRSQFGIELLQPRDVLKRIRS